MNRKTTLAGLALAAVTVGALGVGTAVAGTHSPTKTRISNSTPAAETPSATDSDNVQQGDQSGPDTGATDTPTAGDKADSATATDKPDAEGSGAETPDASDGPGGYADKNSNADTQQEGEH